MVLYGVFEITPVLAEKCISDTCPIESYHDVMLQLHIHSWIHVGDISEGQFSKLIRKSYWSKYNRRTQVMKRKGVCVHSLGIDIEDWAGYVNKVSMKMAIGKNNGVGLQKYVERMEFIRGNGLRGLTMRYGTRRSKVLYG